jgi:pilus assembly protein CpaB
MDRRFLTVLGVSLLFALVISSVFYQMTARAGGSKKVEPTDMRDIVVAARPLSVGVTVKPADIKLSKIPSAAFPKGAFGKAEEVIDRPVISNVLMDEPILDGRLAVRGSGLGLAPIIPVGMRAVTVRVNDVSGISGFVLPGMRVDILVTGRPPSSDGTITATALQNMLVLSAGTAIQADARGQAIQAGTVTLLATPEQAETLTLANNEGRIQLVLRNGSDQTIEKPPGREISELYGLHVHKKPVETAAAPARPRTRVVNVVTAAPPPPPPPPDQIIVIRGTQKSVEVVGVNRPGDGGK